MTEYLLDDSVKLRNAIFKVVNVFFTDPQHCQNLEKLANMLYIRIVLQDVELYLQLLIDKT